MKNKAIIDVLKRIKQSLIVNRNEPVIKQKCDRFGNQYWQIRDPHNNRSYTFGSEQDVRAWLENRHYGFN